MFPNYVFFSNHFSSDSKDELSSVEEKIDTKAEDSIIDIQKASSLSQSHSVSSDKFVQNIDIPKFEESQPIKLKDKKNIDSDNVLKKLEDDKRLLDAKQKDYEESQRKLKYLEESQKRQREIEENQRKQKQLEDDRNQKQFQENQRKQKEFEANQRHQKELEENLRKQKQMEMLKAKELEMLQKQRDETQRKEKEIKLHQANLRSFVLVCETHFSKLPVISCFHSLEKICCISRNM